MKNIYQSRLYSRRCEKKVRVMAKLLLMFYVVLFWINWFKVAASAKGIPHILNKNMSLSWLGLFNLLRSDPYPSASNMQKLVIKRIPILK